MLVNLDDVKTYLWITDDEQDNLLTLLIWKATGYAEWYVGYDLESSEDPKKMNVEVDGSQVFLPYNVHFSIIEVQKNNWTDFTPIWHNISNEEYRYESDTCILFLKYPFKKKLWLEISYNSWYDDTSCPDDLKSAILSLIGYYKANSWTAGDVKSETVDWDKIEYWKISWTWIILEEVKTILDKYKTYDIYS
jgi:hypothetical protein